MLNLVAILIYSFEQLESILKDMVKWIESEAF